ncbi:abortive infection system antitoxin AbiGi family protein [Vibrio sp.]|uniref:abortive infection system antitoxin AbiGi family protein n=1 Tax=Vibrio sp. TaxID=678 RepID=UPI003AA8C060
MIIHFTSKFEFIQSILSSFSCRLSYCGEYFGNKTGKAISRTAHPMMSFSDYSDENHLQKV